MGIVVLVEMQLLSGHVESLKQSLASLLPGTRAFDGCESVEIQENQDDPDNLVAVERWESRAHYDKYFAWRQEAGAIRKINRISARPLSVRYFDDVDI